MELGGGDQGQHLPVPDYRTTKAGQAGKEDPLFYPTGALGPNGDSSDAIGTKSEPPIH